uniref:DUF834 domain-containing protein n=1 Tax=Oryza glumipatula TaxID=40148 RepID=A0A0D9YGH3_9ORYZ
MDASSAYQGVLSTTTVSQAFRPLVSPLPHGRLGGDDLTGARLPFPPPLPRRRPSGRRQSHAATRTAVAGLCPRAQAWEGDLLGGGGTGKIRAARQDLAVEQPAAGLSGAAAVSGGGGSGVEALAAAAEETARSAPGSGGTATGGGVWWRGWRRRRGRKGDGVGEVNLAAPAADPAPGGLAVATVVAMTARATTAGRLRRVSSELDDGDKVWEDDEMAVGMEGQQRLLWWRRRWQGDGVGEANLAAPAADPAPEESGGRGDGGDEFAATAARATTVGSLRRVPSELDDGEKGREDGEMAAGWKGSSGCGGGDRHHGRGRHGNLGWLAGGVADGCIRAARQCLEEGSEAGLA